MYFIATIHDFIRDLLLDCTAALFKFSYLVNLRKIIQHSLTYKFLHKDGTYGHPVWCQHSGVSECEPSVHSKVTMRLMQTHQPSMCIVAIELGTPNENVRLYEWAYLYF